jgi:hypothetical protein
LFRQFFRLSASTSEAVHTSLTLLSVRGRLDAKRRMNCFSEVGEGSDNGADAGFCTVAVALSSFATRERPTASPAPVTATMNYSLASSPR